MSAVAPGVTVEEPLWFGPEELPLAGWLTRPTNNTARGGVLLAPSLGREARSARRALRHLAISLAARGFVTIRFDYFGTGDSSGDLLGQSIDRAWLDSVAEAAGLLRSLGLDSVSAVGIRLGALLAGVAGSTRDLGLTSLVLWDPCESGRTFIRELSILEALRRVDFEPNADGLIETSEITFTQGAVDDIRRLSLLDSGLGQLADRVLVITREDRVVSEKFRASLDRESVDWSTTDEQGPMFEVEPLDAVMPEVAINRIINWLSTGAGETTVFESPTFAMSMVVAQEKGYLPVKETFVALGPHQLFGIVSEPVGEVRGPWIVMLNVANEEHTGPARLWVELSRRWSARGLRCVRFDLSGLGDSPWLPGDRNLRLYDRSWLDDVPDTLRALSPEDPSNSVLVGLCSGAYLAVEGALSVPVRGVCAINPPVGMDFLHGTARLETSHFAPIRLLAVELKEVALRLRWVAAALWDVRRKVLPSSWTVDVMAKVVDNGTDLLVLATTEDLAPLTKVPFLRSLDGLRIASPRNYHVEFVDRLDHSMQNADGRSKAVAIIDERVLGTYANLSPRSNGTAGVEGS